MPASQARAAARVARYFNIGVTGFALWLCMAAYLIVWVKYIKKFPGEWEEYWPKAIPIAAVCARAQLPRLHHRDVADLGLLSLPPIMFFLLMGGIQSAHFIPRPATLSTAAWTRALTRRRREQFCPELVFGRARAPSLTSRRRANARRRCRRRIVLRPLLVLHPAEEAVG